MRIHPLMTATGLALALLGFGACTSNNDGPAPPGPTPTPTPTATPPATVPFDQFVRDILDTVDPLAAEPVTTTGQSFVLPDHQAAFADLFAPQP